MGHQRQPQSHQHTQQRQTLAHNGKILCVDLDGTLAGMDPDASIGDPNRPLIAALKRARKAGWYIIVNSCRSTLDYEAVWVWLEHYSVPYDQIALGVKPIADVYVDDKGWFPDANTLLQGLEWRSLTIPGRDHGAYYQELAQERLTSPFAANIAQTPEGGASRESEYDPSFRVLLPITGGMESLTLWRMARESGMPYELVYVVLGQQYAAAELRTIGDLLPQEDAERLHILDLQPHVQPHVYDHILVGRNAIILLECLRLATANGWWGEVWFGALGGESPHRGGDKSRRFLNDIQTLLGPTLRVVTPLIGLDKTDEVRSWEASDYPLSMLLRTKSCFDPQMGQCGHCQTCFRKAVAFLAVGESLSLLTDLFPRGWDFTPYVAKYEQVMTNALRARDYSHYSPSRIRDTLYAINRLKATSSVTWTPGQEAPHEHQERHERQASHSTAPSRPR